jgi:hypothetical protein
MVTVLSDDITELRVLLGSVYLTPRQRAALGRLLGSAARSPLPRGPSLPNPKPEVRSPKPAAPILTEAEKERERAELLGPIGGGQ